MNTTIDQEAVELLARELHLKRKPITRITDYKIILFIAEGLTAKEIGNLLELSPRTIEMRINKLKEILEAKTQAELISIMYQKMILKIPN